MLGFGDMMGKIFRTVDKGGLREARSKEVRLAKGVANAERKTTE